MTNFLSVFNDTENEAKYMAVTSQRVRKPTRRPTQRAPDGWESARFRAVFLAQASSVKMALSRPAHPRVTLTVRRTSTSRKGRFTMFTFWLILGTFTILAGIFNRQVLQFLGSKPLNEVITTPNLQHSSKTVEKIGQWLVITLGISFVVLGLGEVLPNNISHNISFSLLGLSGLMLLTMIGITIANWRAK